MKTTLLCFSLLAACSLSARAQTIVSEQFTVYEDHNLSSSAVAGVVPVDNWNVMTSMGPGNQSDNHIGLTFTQTGLVDSTGVATGIGYSINYDAQYQGNSSIADSNNNKLLYPVYFNRYTDDVPAVPQLSLTLTGLASTDLYNIYVYVNSPNWGNGTSSSISLGGTTYNFTTDASLTSFVQITAGNTDGNYVVFSGVTGSSTQQITIPTSTAGISAFQIVDLGPATSAPEPSTWALLGMGSGFLFWFQRRRVSRL